MHSGRTSLPVHAQDSTTPGVNHTGRHCECRAVIMHILTGPLDVDKPQHPLRLKDSPPPPPGSAEALWLQRDAEARQRAEDRDLERRLCGLLDTTPERMARALLRLLAPGIAEIADAGGER